MQNSQSSPFIDKPGVSNAMPESYHNATGKIRYTMTNDYMFNVIFQNTDITAMLYLVLSSFFNVRLLY